MYYLRDVSEAQHKHFHFYFFTYASPLLTKGSGSEAQLKHKTPRLGQFELFCLDYLKLFLNTLATNFIQRLL